MKVQINFTTDDALKKKALQKAKKEGIPLKVVLNFFLKSYCSDDFECGIKYKKKNEIPSREELIHYKKAKEDLANNDVISGEEAFQKLGV
jgi:hypothetical protein